MTKLEKGMVAYHCGIFHVVVEVMLTGDGVELFCICDHANNIFSFNVSDFADRANSRLIERTDITALEATGAAADLGREIPWDVIGEVLLGRHDHRFDHWKK